MHPYENESKSLRDLYIPPTAYIEQDQLPSQEHEQAQEPEQEPEPPGWPSYGSGMVNDPSSPTLIPRDQTYRQEIAYHHPQLIYAPHQLPNVPQILSNKLQSHQDHELNSSQSVDLYSWQHMTAEGNHQYYITNPSFPVPVAQPHQQQLNYSIYTETPVLRPASFVPYSLNDNPLPDYSSDSTFNIPFNGQNGQQQLQQQQQQRQHVISTEKLLPQLQLQLQPQQQQQGQQHEDQNQPVYHQKLQTQPPLPPQQYYLGNMEPDAMQLMSAIPVPIVSNHQLAADNNYDRLSSTSLPNQQQHSVPIYNITTQQQVIPVLQEEQQIIPVLQEEQQIIPVLQEEQQIITISQGRQQINPTSREQVQSITPQTTSLKLKAVQPPKPIKKRSFQCTSCTKAFTSKWNLRQHYEITHLDSPRVNCPLCTRSFKRRSDVTRHLREIHHSNNQIAARSTRGRASLPPLPVKDDNKSKSN